MIENSIKHNEEKEELKIEIISKYVINPKIKDIEHNGKFLYISIQDNGKGVKDDKKEWIFLPTKTTSKVGGGLGLYIIKRALEKMKGFIVETGKYGNGAKFEIFIPCNEGKLDE